MAGAGGAGGTLRHHRPCCLSQASTASTSGRDQEDPHPAHLGWRGGLVARSEVPVGVRVSGGPGPGSPCAAGACWAGREAVDPGTTRQPPRCRPVLAGQRLGVRGHGRATSPCPPGSTGASGSLSALQVTPPPCRLGQLALSLDHLESTQCINLGPSPDASPCPTLLPRLLTGPATGVGAPAQVPGASCHPAGPFASLAGLLLDHHGWA